MGKPYSTHYDYGEEFLSFYPDSSVFVKTDGVETVVYPPGKVDHTLRESSPKEDCFAGELQGPYK